MSLAAVEAKAFVPATDIALSMKCYEALGFEIPFASDDLAYVRHGQTSFQASSDAAFARAFQMSCGSLRRTSRGRMVSDTTVTR